jgi:hypothetical protein
MARKTSFVTIAGDKEKNRDAGKVFKLTEMPPMQSEKWAIRAFLALARGGVEIPEDIAAQGLMGIAILGQKIFGSMHWSDAEPLLDEMLACVQAVPDPANMAVVTPLFESSIDEVTTILTLRKSIFGLHVDFSQLGALYVSAVASSKAAAASSPST